MAASDVLLCPTCGDRSPISPGFAFASPLFDSLASTNEPASDADSTVIREFVLPHALQGLLDVDAQLGRVSAAMKALKADKERLEAEKHRLAEMVSESRGLLSTFRRFPPEVLTEIFLLRHFYKDDLFDTSSGPWPLTYVSRQWRTITIATPTLWTSYDFDYTKDCGSGWQQQLATMLDRAGTHPIHLALSASGSLSIWERKCLAFMVRCAPRWGSLHLELDLELAEIVARMDCELPLLKSLDLSFFNCDVPNGKLVIDDAPLLTDVTLTFHDRVCDIKLPFSRLDTVALHGSGGAESGRPLLENILQRGSRLRSLKVTNTTVHKPCPFVTPSLRFLSTHGMTFLFTAPLLENLEIFSLNTDLEKITSCIRHSHPLKLTDLKLHIRSGEYCRIDNLVILLRHCPALQIVDIGFNRSSSEHEQEIAEAIRSQILPALPNLKSFSISYPEANAGADRRCLCFV